ncbi:MAG: leucine-rich repeat protein [Clostridia bacterium]|nr:leucine-rich repeat protein [Clostridia bacterium]
MKRIGIAALLCLGLVLACCAAGAEAGKSPLTGLWTFVHSDGESSGNYIEFAETGLYIGQSIREAEGIPPWSLVYEVLTWQDLGGGSVRIGHKEDSYTLKGDTLTLTSISSFYGGPITQVFRRVPERPAVLRTILREGGFAFSLDEAGCAVIERYLGDSDPADRELIVPSSLGGHRVTGTEGYAFEDCSKNAVVLPDTLTSIGDYAFWRANITRVVIPEGVNAIGASAFSGNLFEEISIPASVRVIGERAFDSCRWLTELTLPEGVAEIGDCAFESCARLQRVSLPASLARIGENAFADCSELTEIILPAGHPRYYTDGGILYGAEDRRLICYPSGLEAETFAVPDGIQVIGGGAFSGNQHLTAVAIAGSVTEIGPKAFSDCKHLLEVLIPDSVTAIGEEAFAGCWSLAEVSIPAGVTELSIGLFARCVELTRVTLSDGLSVIGPQAFWECDSLCDVRFPDSLTIIGYDAFRDCYSLTEAVLPEGVRSIGSGAFNDCKSLTSVSLPASLTEIGYRAFTVYDRKSREEVPNANLVLTVRPGTYAEQYCRKTGFNYVCAE